VDVETIGNYLTQSAQRDGKGRLKKRLMARGLLAHSKYLDGDE